MRKLVAGNWKMNGNRENLLEIKKVSDRFSGSEVDIVVCPPFTLLSAAKEIAANIFIGAQNLHVENSGAYTGEISADMLEDLGVTHAIIGHSERRTECSETNDVVARKVKTALKKKLNAIICIGESEPERKENKTLSVLKEQIYGSLKDITGTENIIVAYEPIWAIGTGRTPSLAEISTTHDSIRLNLLEMYGSSASNIPILYGGSVNGLNAPEIFSVANVNGALVGGASLSFDTFSPIIKAIENKT